MSSRNSLQAWATVLASRGRPTTKKRKQDACAAAAALSGLAPPACCTRSVPGETNISSFASRYPKTVTTALDLLAQRQTSVSNDVGLIVLVFDGGERAQ